MTHKLWQKEERAEAPTDAETITAIVLVAALIEKLFLNNDSSDALWVEQWIHGTIYWICG